MEDTEKVYALQQKLTNCVEKYSHEFDNLLQGDGSP